MPNFCMNEQNFNVPPMFLHRAYMLDVSNRRAADFAEMKRLIDLLSLLKYNELFCSREGRFSPEDASALEAYCAKKSIKLMPAPDRIPGNYSYEYAPAAIDKGREVLTQASFSKQSGILCRHC